jgi:hypothetical protein
MAANYYFYDALLEGPDAVEAWFSNQQYGFAIHLLHIQRFFWQLLAGSCWTNGDPVHGDRLTLFMAIGSILTFTGHRKLQERRPGLSFLIPS